MRNYGASDAQLHDHAGLPLRRRRGQRRGDARAPATRDGARPTAARRFNVQLHDRRLQAADLDAERRRQRRQRLRCCRRVEFDGYLTLGDGTDSDHAAVARPAAQVGGRRRRRRTASVARRRRHADLSNTRRRRRRVDVFALTGTSPQIRSAVLPGPGDNYAVDRPEVGRRAAADGGGRRRRSSPSTPSASARTRTTRPSSTSTSTPTATATPDFVVYNPENGGFASTGQNVVASSNLEHRRRQRVLLHRRRPRLRQHRSSRRRSSRSGMTPGTPVRLLSVYAFDNYFTGGLTDAIESMT